MTTDRHEIINTWITFPIEGLTLDAVGRGIPRETVDRFCSLYCRKKSILISECLRCGMMHMIQHNDIHLDPMEVTEWPTCGCKENQ